MLLSKYFNVQLSDSIDCLMIRLTFNGSVNKLKLKILLTTISKKTSLNY